MIIKKMDSKEKEIAELEALLRTSDALGDVANLKNG